MALSPEDLMAEPEAPRSKLWRDTKGQHLPARLWLQEADRVAELLADEVRANPTVDAGWPRLPTESALDLFAGSAGVAFFLATHAVVSGNQPSRDLAMAILKQGMKAIRHQGVERLVLTGGLVGPASFAWVLTHASVWLDQPTWLDNAVEILTRAAGPRRGDAQAVGVVEGIAGLLMVVLTVHGTLADGHSQRGELVALAERCGVLLLDRMQDLGGGLRGWLSHTQHRPLSGFAHGASGIAVALALLDQLIPLSRLRRAIVQALDFEESLYLNQYGNWTIAPGDSLRPVGWCYGAPGIAMARQLMLSTPCGGELQERLRRDLDLALRTCWTAPKAPYDHICCGLSSRVIALLQSSWHSESNTDREAAEVIGYFVLRATRTKRKFRIPDDEFSKSLFHGISGIGLAFLHLGSADRLPCPLILN